METDHFILNLKSDKDCLFDSADWPKPFEFSEAVVKVFDDMVSRSVPLYRDVNESVLFWTHSYYQKDSSIVDLGCSTGTTLEVIGRHFKSPIIMLGVDTSQPMLDVAKDKLAGLSKRHQIDFLQCSLEDVELPKASVIILNYTLQFIPVRKRLPILQKIFTALKPDGIVYISEKIRYDNLGFQETTNRIYENFKHRAGYSQSEIERKKEALDQVLVPMTIEQLSAMIKTAGFSVQETVLKWNNFVSIVAQKS